MNKADLVNTISTEMDISKAAAEKALKAFIDAVSQALQKGDRVRLFGFGSFEVINRPAREARNPQTGAPIKINASKVPRFRPGKALKDALK